MLTVSTRNDPLFEFGFGLSYEQDTTEIKKEVI